MEKEKIIIKDGKIKKVKEKNKMTKREIINKVFFFLSVFLFLLVLNNKINYVIFIETIFIYSMFLITTNDLIIKILKIDLKDNEINNLKNKKKD